MIHSPIRQTSASGMATAGAATAPAMPAAPTTPHDHSSPTGPSIAHRHAAQAVASEIQPP